MPEPGGRVALLLEDAGRRETSASVPRPRGMHEMPRPSNASTPARCLCLEPSIADACVPRTYVWPPCPPARTASADRRRERRPASKGVDRWRPLGPDSSTHAAGGNALCAPVATRPASRPRSPTAAAVLVPAPPARSAPARRVRGREQRLVLPGGCHCGALQQLGARAAQVD